ncbi:MAG TPA: hypothetical protein PLY34_03080 [Ferruginibacter sp.]|nr:hypothetical protein [Ferruginibacter sp.]HPH91424.1 hypothetical protein [Ferruginibacter sp.]
MGNLPLYLPVLFIITTMITVFFIAKAFNFSKMVIALIVGWLTLQAVIASTGFYTNTTFVPPGFVLAIVPPVAAVILMFSSIKGRRIIDSLPAGTLTLLHIVRVPVEITLLLLFIHKTIPVEMTFEGRNFDIVSGITAPVVYYSGFVKKKFKTAHIIAWNFGCILLLINIVATAILSVQFPFQQFGFDQPNIAVLHAPYVWLPCFIVPAVLFSHLVVIRQMCKVVSAAG